MTPPNGRDSRLANWHNKKPRRLATASGANTHDQSLDYTMIDEPISQFLSAKHNYLLEMAAYLDSRGLTIRDVPCVPLHTKDWGLRKADGSPFPLEGWAYCLRGPEGEVRNGQFVLRVCNYPDEGELLFWRRDGLEWFDRPKFLQCFKGEYLHYTRPRLEVVAAEVVMLHEKVTSAELCTKLLGVPSLAVNGCLGWSKGGELAAELKSLLGALMPRAKLVVCFDGDIISNRDISMSAARLKGAISTFRPDIEVIFPALPDFQYGVGWDDWTVGQGEGAIEAWAKTLAADGVEIIEALPIGYLMTEFGVIPVKDGKSEKIDQTAANYEKLLRYPRWDGVTVDYNGDVYRDGEYQDGGSEALFHLFFCWLESSVCYGYGSKVKEGRAREAFNKWMEARRVAVVLELLREQEPVGVGEARKLASDLLDGLGYVGPMERGEAEETVLRMFRDIARKWSLDRDVDVQWVWSLIGPSGCGKSMSSQFIFDGLAGIGYRMRAKGEIAKGGFAKLEEENRKARNCLVLAMDDYNPSAPHASDCENMLYTLTSGRMVTQREPYGREPEELLRRAVIFLSTTDKSRQFVRSIKGGGERRFIVMEIAGSTMVGGMLRVDREKLSACGLGLLVWAAHGAVGAGEDVATEYSERYASDYVRGSVVSHEIVLPTEEVFLEVMGAWYREGSNDYRFSLPMLAPHLGVKVGNGGRGEALANHIIECGAVAIGQARVWISPGKEVRKDCTYSVADARKFYLELCSKC